MTPRRRPPLLVAIALMAFVAASCTPSPVTLQGEDVSSLYRFFFVAAIVVFCITAGLIAWSIIRYRAKEGDNELPDQYHSNVKLEIAWFAIPQILVIILFLFSAAVLTDIDAEPSERSGEPVTVQVQGFQWGWSFDYEGSDVSLTGIPEDLVTITLPVDRPITFELTSDDVIHAFYVPKFLIKRDVVPGRVNRINVTIDETGTYQGFCAEFCGLLHSHMLFRINAVSDAEFDNWLEKQEGAADGG
jgi:cytochrome c oxidase subunit 2